MVAISSWEYPYCHKKHDGDINAAIVTPYKYRYPIKYRDYYVLNYNSKNVHLIWHKHN